MPAARQTERALVATEKYW